METEPATSAGHQYALADLHTANFADRVELGANRAGGDASMFRRDACRDFDRGIGIDALYATGGGAKSRPWLQMKADVLGFPVHRLGNDEAGTVGVIMLTGVACGVYPDLDTAAKTFVSVTQTYEPRPARHAAYAELYEKYRGLYPAIRPLV